MTGPAWNVGILAHAAAALACAWVAACDGTQGDVLVSLQPAGGTGCVTHVDGGLSADCDSPEVWLKRAFTVCSTDPVLGALSDPLYLGTCGNPAQGFVLGVKYDCCPLPASNGCTPEKQGDGTACRDATAWKVAASKSCTVSDTVIEAAPSLDGLCADGASYLFAAYRCCPP
jgi:hypothetical protein